MKRIVLTAAAVAAATTLFAAGETVKIEPPAEGSVSAKQGLEAWDRIFEVTSHPRCSNCHTGPSDRPMWSGPAYGKARQHGMNIQAGESRMGIEYLPCSTCHTTKDENWDNANAMPHAAPRVAMNWALAPAEAHWFGRTSEQICAQLRDPELNGDRDMMALASHLDHDLILHWAWAPGGGREPAPYSLQEHVNDILEWGVAGMPCPQD
ncbi:MAG: hypothetical protein AAF891_11540 [Pseudomonadota bacterium]